MANRPIRKNLFRGAFRVGWSHVEVAMLRVAVNAIYLSNHLCVRLIVSQDFICFFNYVAWSLQKHERRMKILREQYFGG